MHSNGTHSNTLFFSNLRKSLINNSTSGCALKYFSLSILVFIYKEIIEGQLADVILVLLYCTSISKLIIVSDSLATTSTVLYCSYQLDLYLLYLILFKCLLLLSAQSLYVQFF